jgi:hypothetical protein
VAKDHAPVFGSSDRLKLALGQNVFPLKANLLGVVMPGEFPRIGFEPIERAMLGSNRFRVGDNHCVSPFS